MKKIFTLLFTIGMFTLAQAQPGNRDNRQPDRRDIPPTDQRNDKTFDQRDYDDDVDNTNHNRRDNDDRYGKNDDCYDYNDDRYDYNGNSRFGNERRMRMQIAQINREFDYKTEKVRNSFYMSRWEKQRQIRFLEERRQQEIRKVYFRFKYNRGYDDRDFPDRHHY